MRDNTFFISDTHFGHEGVLDFCARPFKTAAQMDAAMITAWNSVVGPRDTVVHGGDFAFCSAERAQFIFDKLNGKKVLVRGNHDRNKHLKLGWESVHEILDTRIAGQRIIVCHYPMREWPGYYRNAIHLFGHSHSSMPSSNRALDIGVDNIGFTPLRLPDLQKIMDDLPASEWRRGHAPDPKKQLGVDDSEDADDVGLKV
ncbi:metallophosphoesterase family protein [Pelagibacterium luteolum]|uniref:Calcineurin-like phosphoesterase superfamily protein n=1 Tax=Pelagibacterium luteolum TaxID=440168 RepID=A0A1G7XHK5_9HYPH|nr:metallophosphoesterase family protein [Pelagibacterium luteolum]SDG83708.1 Calcineurin-like phosphoesterase superfamily protein [Pelagibacterium luteolum]